MVQRSTNQKKRIKKNKAHAPKGISQNPSKEVRALRQHRTRRYQERRALLKASQIKPRRRLSLAERQALQMRAKTVTVVGQTQRKRVRRRHVTQSNSGQSRLGAQRFGSDQSPPRHRKRQRPHPHLVRRRQKDASIRMMRLLMAGVGVALVAGFGIALLHPEPSGRARSSSGEIQFQEATPVSQEKPSPPPLAYEKPGKELRQLKQEVRGLVEQQPDLTTGLFFLNPETEEFISYRGSEVFPAASMIKLPLLIAFFQDVDAGKIQLNEKLTMRPDLIATEAGAMQYDQPGSQYDALQTADWMITISDNTATNMVIDRLGGQEKVNQRFLEWGLEQTKINQPLPDLEGTNTMSPKDLAVLMAKVSQGDLLTAHSRDRALEILRHTVTNTLLPQGIGESAQIAHKTGDIGMAVGDVGLIDMPNGQRYVATVVVKRPHNDPRAQELIRAISTLTYQGFSERPVPRPKSAVEAATPPPPVLPQ